MDAPDSWPDFTPQTPRDIESESDSIEIYGRRRHFLA